MFKQSEEKIKKVFDKLLSDDSSLSSGIHQNNLNMIWENLMGKTVAKYTSSIELKGAVLYIRVSSSSLRSELQFEQDRLLEKVNAVLQYKKVSKVVIA